MPIYSTFDMKGSYPHDYRNIFCFSGAAGTRFFLLLDVPIVSRHTRRRVLVPLIVSRHTEEVLEF